MRLSRLLGEVGLSCPAEAEVTGVTCDSRAVRPGMVFVALKGAREDGARFIPEAVERGAAAVVRGPGADSLPAGTPEIVVEEPRKAVGPLAAAFYGRPADGMTMIAITGTKGKTTTAYMVRDILTEAGYRVGMIGTTGAFAGREALAEPGNTTPEPTLLHRLLRQMADRGCTHVVMEASSQAMKLHRLAGITFDAGLFLNLSPDHIGPGEHESMEEYRDCKAALFRQCRIAVGNGDDPAWPFLAARRPEGAPVITFGFGPGADTRCLSIGPDRERGPLHTRIAVAGAEPYVTPMPGEFNGRDALAAAVLCRALWVGDEAVRAGLAKTSVPGRAQVFPTGRDYAVLIDYAHNGESARALLSTLAGYDHRRIIAVFGAGGDRPRARRRDMARAAAEWADFAIVTEDNPRGERTEDICRDITDTLGDAIPWLVIPDRREAIRQALDMARSGDIVALLGKGHERYIEEKGVRREFSEWGVLEEYFGGEKRQAGTRA